MLKLTTFHPEFGSSMLVGGFVQAYFQETYRLLRLSVPVTISQLAQVGFGTVDAIMSGHSSVIDQSAIAIACAVFTPILLFSQNLISSLSSIVAQFNGAKTRQKIAHPTFQSLWLAAFVSIPVMLSLYYGAPLVSRNLGNPALEQMIIRYLRSVLWGVPGYLLFIVVRSLNNGLSKTLPAMFICCFGFLVNVPVNYAFIYGKFGAPALGAAGCGVTTAIIYWGMAIAFLAYTLCDRDQKDVVAFKHYERPHCKTLAYLVRLGLPTGLACLFEISSFTIVSKLLADLGCIQVAAHVSAMNYSSLVFVFPMSIAVATTVRVGHRLGEGGLKATRVVIRIALALALTCSVLTAACTFLFRASIAALYTANPAVAALLTYLLLFSAIFQCCDAVQIVAIGILRGYRDMRAILIIAGTSYWMLGFPSGYILAKTNLIVPPLGAAGFWIGFIIGLTSAAILLFYRIGTIQKETTGQGVRAISCG